MDLTPLDVWRRAMVDSVRRDAPDLSARQMAILLTVYMTKPPHTVRGLAEMLNISKPAVTRALDRLGEFKLARRKSDPRDRRSVLIQRSVKGSVYLAEFAEIIAEANKVIERDRLAQAAQATKPSMKTAEANTTIESAPPAQAKPAMKRSMNIAEANAIIERDRQARAAKSPARTASTNTAPAATGETAKPVAAAKTKPAAAR